MIRFYRCWEWGSSCGSENPATSSSSAFVPRTCLPRLLRPTRKLRAENAPEAVWHRIKAHQGEEFRTATRLPFTYEVEGTGIWFFRNGRRIERKLSRAQVEKAIARCPLNSTTEIKDLMDYAYLFGLLTDARIRADAW